MKNLSKKILLLLMLIGVASQANDFRDYRYNNNSNIYYHNNNFKPYYYKKHHKLHKRAHNTRYYHTNNPNIKIMIKNSHNVSQRDIKRALKQFLVQNYYINNRYWR
jgi:hypothetical protein